MNQYGEQHPIHEIHRIKEILQYISFDTLICWDIDNTLLQAKHELGSDQWFVCLMEFASQQLEKYPEAKIWALEIYTEVQHMTQAHLVEDIVVKFIKYFQAIGLPQLIITARSPELKQTTLRQLHDNKLNFSEKELIFCAGQSKAEALKNILPQLPHVKHFIMIDDKVSHVHEIQRMARQINMRYDGFSYRHLDDKVHGFDMRLASTQLRVLFEELPQNARAHINSLELLKMGGFIRELSSFSFFADGRHVVYSPKDEEFDYSRLKAL